MQDDEEWGSPEEMDMYLQFDLVLSDVSAFLVDGEYRWDRSPPSSSPGSSHLGCVSYLPVIDKCAVILKLQQVKHILYTEHLRRMELYIFFFK